MHRELRCGGFPAAYSHLNSLKRIDASWLAIARNMMCLEAEHVMRPYHPDAMLCFNSAFWEALKLFKLNLRPRAAFILSPATRLGRKSYLAGEAFTRWFAQEALRLSVVKQFEFAQATVVGGATGSAKSKPGAPSPNKTMTPRRKPDFLGFSGSTPHLLESKGSAGRRVRDNVLESNLADGLVQVSMIRSVNGLALATRTACSFAFDLNGVRGSIWDPSEETESFDIGVNLAEMTRNYYRGFLTREPLQQFDSGFVGYEVVKGVRIAVDPGVIERVDKLESNDRALDFFDYLDARKVDFSDDRGPDVSVGPDGIRLDVDDRSLRKYARLVGFSPRA